MGMRLCLQQELRSGFCPVLTVHMCYFGTVSCDKECDLDNVMSYL
jgi:hypothetical protein